MLVTRARMGLNTYCKRVARRFLSHDETPSSVVYWVREVNLKSFFLSAFLTDIAADELDEAKEQRLRLSSQRSKDWNRRAQPPPTSAPPPPHQQRSKSSRRPLQSLLTRLPQGVPIGGKQTNLGLHTLKKNKHQAEHMAEKRVEPPAVRSAPAGASMEKKNQTNESPLDHGASGLGVVHEPKPEALNHSIFL
jgi:hypothetical protein